MQSADLFHCQSYTEMYDVIVCGVGIKKRFPRQCKHTFLLANQILLYQ